MSIKKSIFKAYDVRGKYPTELNEEAAFQIAAAVELGALVIESVRYFMADRVADAAIIDRIIRVLVEKRRLEDGGGKDDFVHAGIEVGIDRLRRHEPLIPVNRPFQLPHGSSVFELGRAEHVSRVIVGANEKSFVAFEALGIADLPYHHREFRECFLFRLGTHPIERVYTRFVCGEKVVDENVHHTFCAGPEVFRDIKLP